MKKGKPIKSVSPVATIVKKSNYIVPILILLVLAVVAVSVIIFKTVPSKQGVVATVNGEPIYEKDIALEYNRLPAEYKAQYSRELILNQTIDKKLLFQEAARRGLTVSDTEVLDQVQEILAQFGIGDKDLETILAAQNVTIEEYRNFVREELLLTKIVDDAVTSRIAVSDKEVAEYYDAHSEEFSAPSNGVVVSHILVENESLAKEIITKLGQGESFSSLAEKYSIDNGTAIRGGYLGIVVPDSGYVKEFENASLKLRGQQYTRTPVKTMFGYHIIKREDDKEPFRYVRDRIENQLKVEQQYALFNNLITELRAKATIKFYTNEGVVSVRDETTVSLDDFAYCVAQKSTLYGTPWSEFSKEQETLFGESASLLNVVNCDDEPQACADAKVVRYPTWVIGEQQYGKLTLQELSNYTDCALP